MFKELKFMKIGKFNIGLNHKPFVIAEMSGNHGGSLAKALKIVDAVSKTGASAIKLQTYKPETMTIKSKRREFQINDKKNLWSGNSLFDLYKKAQTPWSWHKPIMQRAKERGLVCFSSPFDDTAVDFLEGLKVPAYKIASFENNHFPLIKKVAKTGKPMIISTGMASKKEIKEAINVAKSSGCKNIILLKCTSSYPADPRESNILSIKQLRKEFNCEVGLSDHTLGIGVSISGVANGASVIEKHVTLNRKSNDIDSAFSLEPNELSSLVIESENAWKSLGNKSIGPSKSEIKSIKYRRSIYIVKNIKKNDLFNQSNISVIRPSNGIHPKYFEKIIGKKSARNLKSGTPLKLSDVKK